VASWRRQNLDLEGIGELRLTAMMVIFFVVIGGIQSAVLYRRLQKFIYTAWSIGAVRFSAGQFLCVMMETWA
jgi:hypothetical protein